jgi:hypothetical protein
MDNRLVDQIVSEVLARLGGTPPAGAAADRSSAPAAAATSSNSTLVLEDPVVTGEVLEDRLNGHAQVTFGRRTVLTPSARDVLRDRGIEWSRSAGNAPAAACAAVGPWLAIVSHTTPAVERLVGEMGDGSAWRSELTGTVEEASRRATSAICRGEATGVLVVSDRPESAACLANRNAQVRAAVVRDAAEVASAARTIGANVLCVAPHGRSSFELRNILRAFIANGSPRVPAGWSES